MNLTKLKELGERVLAGGEVDEAEALEVLQTPDALLFDLLGWTNRVRHHYCGNKVHLCAILNAKSGNCPEDCAFCSQSARHETGIQTFPFTDREEVLGAAEDAKLNGAQCLGIVAAWRGIKEGKLLDEICDRVRALAESGLVRPDASLGLIEEREVAQRLKDAGLEVYNHNLETARSHFGSICSTHSYDDRLRTIEHLKAVGLKVCCGGLLGMGESPEQRVELALELRRLDVDKIPLNFLHRIEGTPLADCEPMPPFGILKTIGMFRFVLPGKELMIAGGREVNLRDLQPLVFPAGANAIMVGNYLTTGGRSAQDDLRMIEDLGLDAQWPACGADDG